jgi:hypothetical protein
MPIPNHQVHNVLTAYARRLHDRRMNGYSQNASETDVFGHRRRGLIQRMTMRYIDKVIRQHAIRPQPAPLGRNPLDDDPLIYHEIDACHQKTTRHLGQRAAPPQESLESGLNEKTDSNDPAPG